MFRGSFCGWEQPWVSPSNKQGVRLWVSTVPTPELCLLTQLLQSPSLHYEKRASVWPSSPEEFTSEMRGKFITLQLYFSVLCGKTGFDSTGIKTCFWSSHADQHRVVFDSLYDLDMIWNLNKRKTTWQYLWRRGSVVTDLHRIDLRFPIGLANHTGNYRKWYLSMYRDPVDLSICYIQIPAWRKCSRAQGWRIHLDEITC